MQGEILGEDWNTPYVSEFHKSGRVGDVQHRNPAWLTLRKHSEIDRLSPLPGRTARCIPVGLARGHLELLRFNISPLLLQKGSKNIAAQALRLRCRVVCSHEFFFVPVVLWEINCKQSETRFCSLHIRKHQEWRRFLVTNSFFFMP